jgi:glycine oxidase
MPIKKPQSIIVVGAGPVGLCCALALTQAGHAVRVVDSGERGAGWASGGMLGAVYETLDRPDVPAEFTDMAFESLSLWRELAAQLAIETLSEPVFVARSAGEALFLKLLAGNPLAALTQIQLPVGLTGQSAWRCAADLALDPRATLLALHKACVLSGVTFIRGKVTTCLPRSITLCDATTHSADTIILATGQGGDGLRDSVPELAHILPVKGQLLAVAADFDWQRGTPMPHLRNKAALACRVPTVIRAGRLYIIPRSDHIVIGATSHADDLDHMTIDRDAQRALYQEAMALCPNLTQSPIVESWAGLRPMTPDGLPMIGASRTQSIILATGTYRNGWLLAPAIAKSILAIVTDDDTATSKLQSFSPLRFPI